MSTSIALPHSRATHPPTVLLAALLLEVVVSFLPDPVEGLPWLVQLSGSLLLVVGVAINIAAVHAFGRRETPVHPSETPRVLVTHGVFGWSRNPMYVGLATILFGAAMALDSVWAVLVVPVFVLWIDRLIRHEERRLLATFGRGYEAYRRRVRRWL
jgi:protein-S-isoprenylcysteine O-methyltransferase Ste14